MGVATYAHPGGGKYNPPTPTPPEINLAGVSQCPKTEKVHYFFPVSLC